MEFRKETPSKKAISSRTQAEWLHNIQEHSKLDNIFLGDLNVWGKTTKKSKGIMNIKIQVVVISDGAEEWEEEKASRNNGNAFFLS